MGQIKISSLYYNAVFNTIIYLSLASSVAFLAIAAIQLLRWFIRGKNYLVMTYGLVMLVLCTNSIIGISYVSQVSSSHSNTIKYKSCSVMMGALGYANPVTCQYSSQLIRYHFFFFLRLGMVSNSFDVEGIDKHKNKLVYWLIFALPLIFFLPK